jgi:acetyl-CoA carboxylase biotin carboxyl carrier protein
MSEEAGAPGAGDAPEQRHSGNRHKRHHRPPSGMNKGRHQERVLNLEELTELVELISSYGFNDFELVRDDFRVRLRRDLPPIAASAAPVIAPVPVAAPPFVPAAPAPAAPPHPGAGAEKAAATDDNLTIIKSPIVGTFYRSASPTAEPFVKTGSRVAPDTVVCIIEAMKLMNEIQAEMSGEVAKIYVENGTPVEFGQPLFGIKK